jgi:modification methylase
LCFEGAEIAALRSGRNSVGVEIDADYCRLAARYLKAEANDLFSSAKPMFEKADAGGIQSAVREHSQLT